MGHRRCEEGHCGGPKKRRLKVLDDRELVVEFESEEDFEHLSGELWKFGDQLDMERI
jgi:hypothetical protein